MQFIFITATLVFACYFLFRNRPFDFYTVAFFSAVIYFMPGFFGFANLPSGRFFTVFKPVALVNEVYLVM